MAHSKVTSFDAKHSNAIEYEDHPFQPSRITASQQRDTKEEQQPLIVCRNLKARLLHGKERKFERDESRRTEGHTNGLPV
jgi:hypothetical protein